LNGGIEKRMKVDAETELVYFTFYSLWSSHIFAVDTNDSL